jgi:hypothetical protein
MQPIFAQARRMAIGILAVMVLAAPAMAEPSFRGTVFDSKITQKLKVKGQTRAQVSRITSTSAAELQGVLNKYKINPRKKLDFDTMMRASSELQAVRNKESAEMRKVLTPEEFNAYETITSQTSRKVRRAME